MGVGEGAGARRSNQIQHIVSAVLVLAVIVLGVVQRSWGLDQRGYWYDELYSTLASSTATSIAQMYNDWLRSDGHPPGYQTLMYFWFQVFPNTEFWGRVPSCFFGLAMMPAFYWGFRGWLGREERIAGLLLIASSSILVYYSQASRQYIWLVFWEFASLALWARYLGKRRALSWRWSLGFFLTTLLMAYVHYFGLIVAGLLVGHLFVRDLRADQRWKPWALFITLWSVAYAPALITLHKVMATGLGAWQPFIPLDRFAGQLIRAFAFSAATPAYVLLLVVGLATIVPALRAPAAGPREPDPIWRQFHGIVIALALAVGVLAIFKPILQVRYMLIFLPFFVIYGCRALWRIGRHSRGLQYAGLCLLLGAGLNDFDTYRTTIKQRWNDAVRYTLALASETAKVYVLGPDDGREAAEYLEEGDTWRYFYVRNHTFFQYYFDRFDTEDHVSELHSLDHRATDLVRLVETDLEAHEDVYILAGHHLKIPPASPVFLSQSFAVSEKKMRGTIVYQFTRSNSTDRPTVRAPKPSAGPAKRPRTELL